MQPPSRSCPNCFKCPFVKKSKSVILQLSSRTSVTCVHVSLVCCFVFISITKMSFFFNCSVLSAVRQLSSLLSPLFSSIQFDRFASYLLPAFSVQNVSTSSGFVDNNLLPSESESFLTCRFSIKSISSISEESIDKLFELI